MGSSTINPGWGFGLTLVILVGVAAGAATAARLGVGRQVVTAVIRACLQLAAVSAVIVAVVRSLWLTAVFVGLMFGAALWTSARRVSSDRTAFLSGIPIAAGVLPVLGVAFRTTAVPITGIAIVPVAGIIIGGTMTATSQAGRRALDELRTRRGEYEAGLSIGLRERDAALEVCRAAATQALIPPMDQTRTVGLVTLPGAFVGVLLGSVDAVGTSTAETRQRPTVGRCGRSFTGNSTNSVPREKPTAPKRRETGRACATRGRHRGTGQGQPGGSATRDHRVRATQPQPRLWPRETDIELVQSKKWLA